MKLNTLTLRTIGRVTASLIAVVVCLFLMWLAGRFGFSRLLSRYGVIASSLPATTEAIRLAPFDADAHRAQATVFSKFQMYAEARRELELAVSFRPHDDYLWMELGIVRDEVGDSEGALTAFDRAVENAPFYAHTHWQRANLRLRLGLYDEAFAELRTAADSNHRFLPTLIDLAWNLSGQNVQVTEQLAGIQSTAARIEFARFLARKGKGKETLDEFRQVATQIAPVYRTELVRELIATKQFPEAFEIWRNANTDKAVNSPAVYDGGFEGAITFSESGFGWRILHDPKLDVSQDGSDKDTGARSLRIVFNGHSVTPDSIVSQIIIIRPQTKYRVSFAFKTNDLTSGSPLVLQVSDAVNNQALKDFEITPEAVWRRQSFDFEAPAKCGTIQLKLIRKGCSSGPCQIFGTLWLDSFSIEQLTQ